MATHLFNLDDVDVASGTVTTTSPIALNTGTAPQPAGAWAWNNTTKTFSRSDGSNGYIRGDDLDSATRGGSLRSFDWGGTDPAATYTLCQIRNTGDTLMGGAAIGTDGILHVAYGTGGTLGANVVDMDTLDAGTYYVETIVDISAGSVTVNLYDDTLTLLNTASNGGQTFSGTIGHIRQDYTGSGIFHTMRGWFGWGSLGATETFAELALASGNAAPTCTLTASETTDVEPGRTVTLTAGTTDSDGTSSITSLVQTAGETAVLVDIGGDQWTFVVPATDTGDDFTFRATATDDDSATTTADVTVSGLPSSWFIGGTTPAVMVTG